MYGRPDQGLLYVQYCSLIVCEKFLIIILQSEVHKRRCKIWCLWKTDFNTLITVKFQFPPPTKLHSFNYS